MRDPARIDPILARLRAYWSRWITARRLTAERRRDPARSAWMERMAAYAGFNMQLDDTAPDDKAATRGKEQG